jgi:hypothetical protein
MAAKQASNTGKRSVKHPVISVTKMMPVTGARTTAVKNAAMPTTAKARAKNGILSERGGFLHIPAKNPK